MALEIHAVSTTVSCQVSGGDGHLSAEIDSRPYGLNGGRTQYFPGDTCYVLVYKSANVTIKSTHVTGAGGVSFDAQAGMTVGYNIVREGLTFNSPIASSSKPMPPTGIIKIDEYMYPSATDASGPQYVPNTTVVRLKNWKGSGDPAVAPPSGFVFIEYSPTALVYAFKNLPAIPSGQIFSYPVHAIIYGVATPMAMTFQDIT